MSARKLPWLVCYDIRDPKRLQRLHRYLCHHAAPVQYSVFIGRYAPAELRWLCKGIERIIEPRVDDVRCYPLPDEPCLTQVGTSRSPDGWSLLAELDLALHTLPGIGEGPAANPDEPGPQLVDLQDDSDAEQSGPLP